MNKYERCNTWRSRAILCAEGHEHHWIVEMITFQIPNEHTVQAILIKRICR